MVGDIMSQYYEGFEKRTVNNNDAKTEWDKRRLAVMTGYGFGAGSLYYYWYQQLDRIAPFLLGRLRIIPTPLRLSTAKLCFDMVTFDPFFISLFFFTTSMLTGSSIDSFWTHYKTYFVPTYLAEALVWSPIQLVNFRFVPVIYQPIVVNTFSVGWNAFLSYVKNLEVSRKNELFGKYKHLS